MSDTTIALVLSSLVAISTAIVGVAFRTQISALQIRVAQLEQVLIDHGIPLPGTQQPPASPPPPTA